MSFLYDMVAEFVEDVNEYWQGEEDDSLTVTSSLVDLTPTTSTPRFLAPASETYAALHRVRGQLNDRGRKLGVLEAHIDRMGSEASDMRHNAAELRHYAERPRVQRGGCMACWG